MHANDLKRFRAAAARHQIDPERGATTFEVVRVRAALAMRQQRRVAGWSSRFVARVRHRSAWRLAPLWWEQDDQLWWPGPSNPFRQYASGGEQAACTEDDAFWSIRHQALAARALRLNQSMDEAQTYAEIVREVWLELRRQRQAQAQAQANAQQADQQDPVPPRGSAPAHGG
jgi:hypothetical protein